MNSSKRKNHIKGFTLIELTITIGILGLALTATGGVLISVVRSFQKQAAIQKVERNGDLATRVISERIRKAKNVVLIQNASIGSYNINYLEIHGTDSSGNDIVDLIGVYPAGQAGCAANGYLFKITNPAPDTSINVAKVTSVANRVTNDASDGVGVLNFQPSVSNGTPIQVSVRIDVQSSNCGSVGTQIQKGFVSFATARGSY